MAINDIILEQQVSVGSIERTFNPTASAGFIPVYTATGLDNSRILQNGNKIEYSGSLSGTTVRSASSVYDGIGDIRTIPQNSQTSDYTLVFADAGKQILYPSTANPVLSTFSMYSQGRNNYGQLGQNNITDYSSPVQVGALTNWFQVACGEYYSIGIKQNGTLWAWGRNNSRQLGLGNTTDYSSPVQVGTGTTWYNAAAGTGYSIATKTDGTLWAWGDNSYGQLGLNDRVNRSSPVQVGVLTNWNNIACAKFTTIATKTDGTLWSWGENFFGQLGLGTSSTGSYRSSPVQVGALTNWSKVACGERHTIATKTDGTLWSWGQSVYGSAGQNNTISYSSPVQVGALTTWNKPACGAFHTVVTKTDGTLWVFGRNNIGQLGLGNFTDYSSPVQVGALTTWNNVASHCSCNFTHATTTGGALFVWGRNSYGQQGLNDRVYRSSPVQVGALTSWVNIAVGFEHALGTTLSASTVISTFSIPSNTTTPWPVGTTLTFVNANSAYSVNLSAADTFRLSPTGTTGTKSLSSYSTATALKVGTTEWYITGGGLT